MFGLIKRFYCKKCGNFIFRMITVTETFNIGDSDETYVQVQCGECGELHYVAESNNIENEVIQSSEAVSVKKTGICLY